MTEMIERVARSLARGQYTTPWDQLMAHQRAHYMCMAKRAIREMREPTEAMINSPMARCYNDGPYADKEVRRIFSAMIDVALSPADRQPAEKTEASQS